jgi:NADPH:quinone reductase-like Zn-dependent oxidoreductase
MKAMMATQFGGPEVLEMQDIDKPQPGAQELLVQVCATSVNPVDYKIREQGGSFGLQAPLILGFDASGIVEETGPEVTAFKAGDEVFYTSELIGAQGCNAEYHTVDERIVALKPEHLSHEQAAAIPLAGGTAWQALMVRGGLRVGETVLIHGAGGVGSFAAQIAVAAGARVFVSCSDYMVDIVNEWGVECAINYKSENFVDIVQEATEDEGVDIVFNTVGGDLLTRSIPVTAEFGTLIGILDPEGTLEGAYRKNLAMELVFLQREKETMRALRRLARREQINPVIDSMVGLQDLAQAHERLESGGVKGKIVVLIAT